MKELEVAQKQGLYIAGYISYEFAEYFGYDVHDNAPNPYFVFGLFTKCSLISQHGIDDFLNKHSNGHYPMLTAFKDSVSYEDYEKDLLHIFEHLRRGNTYQVNYTFRQDAQFGGCIFNLYQYLRQRQKVAYGALISFEEKTILSRSPELFFKKPMIIYASNP